MSTSCIENIVRGACVAGGRLLLCRGKAGNLYLPGGHIEFRESARRALEREIAEELNLPARAGRFLGAVEHAFLQDGEWHAEINLVFTLIIDGVRPGEAPASAETWIAFEWMDIERLGRSRLEPAVLRYRLGDWLREDAGGRERFESTPEAWL